MMHSEQAKLVEWFAEETNDAIARTCRIEPGRFRGIAGMPQSMETTPERWTKELRRCVTELGFVGAMLEPRPVRGRRAAAGAERPVLVPGLGGGVRARRPGSHPLGRLQAAGQGELLAALHSGGDARRRGAAVQLRPRRLPRR